MPLFMISGLIGVWKCFTAFSDHTLTLHELKLKRDGLHIEFSVLDWFGRMNKSRYTVNIKDLAPPPVFSDSTPLKGDLFPHTVEVFEVKSEEPSLPWVKYSEIVRRKLFIPKDYAFMDRELMVAIMNGFYIKTTI